MKRNIYDKSFYAMINGAIGKLQTVFRTDVVANETSSFRIVGSFKLSKLRRWLALDAYIHLAFYYVKHRWVYDGDSGTEWTAWIKNSLSSEHGYANTLETVTLGNAKYDAFGFHGNMNGISVPKHMIAGYNKLWNRYYRVANVTDEYDDDEIVDLADKLQYGRSVARLPAFWNTGVPTGRLSADSTVFTESGSGSFSLVDIAQIQAEYQDDIDRDWFARRYSDIMKQKWGSTGISMEVDDAQCELLYDWNGWASGIDIHGTDSSSLGDYVGKTVAPIDITCPPRYFNEPGTVWCVMAVRFPSIVAEEMPYHTFVTPTADNFLGYPEVVRSQPPIEISEDELFLGGDSDSYGKIPYGNWWRYGTNRIGSDFAYNAGVPTGFPLLLEDDLDPSVYGFNTITYDGSTGLWGTGAAQRFFAESSELKHWNLVAKVEHECRSPIPTASESLYAGARHIN